MASILNSKAKFYRYSSQDGNEVDHYVESEADLFIKELSVKQLRTSTSLEEQLNQKKQFQASHSYQPITAKTSGTLSYDDFKQITLNNEELKNNDDSSNVADGKNMSRHMRELALAVKPNSTETKLLEFAMSCNAVGLVQPENRPPDHPINNLHVIENDLFGHLNETGDPQKTARTILRKRKQLLEAMSEPVEIQRKPVPMRKKTLWDISDESIRLPRRNTGRLYTCEKKRLFTIRNNQIVEINQDECAPETNVKKDEVLEFSSTIPCENELPSRLSVEEIKKLPKFQNYNEGNPTKILYLKNLSPHLTEDNLSDVFSEFQESNKPRIIFNLMKKGRMRGQAFVHFHCVEKALEAFKRLNGLIIRGKPLIIQFGTSQR